MKDNTGAREGNRFPAIVLGIAGIAYIAALAALVPVRAWDPDEFQHMQVAWMLWHGMTPYKDFFEHNTLLLQLITAPLFALVHDQQDYVRVIPALFRTISLIFSLMTAAVVWLIGGRIGGPRIALLASVLILGSALFLAKGIEFRPDTLAALMMMIAVYAALRAIDAPRAGEASALCLLLAGVTLAVSVTSTQKVLFAGPGMMIAFAVLMVPRFGISGMLRRAGWASLGFAAGIAPLIVFFASRGVIWEFFDSNVYLNASWPWPGIEPARWRVEKFLAGDPVFAALAFAGCILVLMRWRSRDTSALALLLPLATLAIGIFIIPAPYEQYLFLMLPIAAIPAGIAADALLRTVSHHAAAWIGGAAIGVVLATVVTFNLDAALHRPEHAAMEKLEYIVTQTPPDATIMGGWSTGVAFRKPAFFYWFLHSELRAQLPPAVWQAMGVALRDGTVRPEIVDFDEDIRQLPAGVPDIIRSEYTPTGVRTLWRRRR